jgi:hypothetical protein
VAAPRGSLPAGRRIVCRLSATTPPTLATLDLLARLALEARRSGARLEVLGAPAAVRRLVAAAGLRGAVSCRPCEGSGVEARWQPEEREEALGVEEERDPADLPVRQLEDLD